MDEFTSNAINITFPTIASITTAINPNSFSMHSAVTSEIPSHSIFSTAVNEIPPSDIHSMALNGTPTTAVNDFASQGIFSTIATEMSPNGIHKTMDNATYDTFMNDIASRGIFCTATDTPSGINTLLRNDNPSHRIFSTTPPTPTDDMTNPSTVFYDSPFYCSPSYIDALCSTPTTTAAVKMTNRGGTTFFETPSTTPGSGPRSPNVADKSGFDLAAFNASLNSKGSPAAHVPIYANADFISESQGSSKRESYTSSSVGAEAAVMTPENTFFMREDLRAEFSMRASAHNVQIDPDENYNIPVSIEGFHNFFPLEPMPEFGEEGKKRLSSIIPFRTSPFRVTSEKDAKTYCLRRLHDFKLSNTKCMNVIGQWKQLRHPNIANLRQVFTTKNKFRGGENSIVFIHDFCPGAETMAEFLGRRNTEDAVTNLAAATAAKCSPNASTAASPAAFQRRLLPESTIWSFVIQLSAAIRAIHTAGLSCRVLSDPTKILFIDGGRKAKINCVGVLDVVLFDPSTSRPNAVTYQQQEDLVSFGKLILMLACHSLHVPLEGNGEAKAYEHVTAHYSPDLKRLLGFFLSNTSRLRHINDIMPIVGARFYAHIDALETINDVVEIEAGKEIQNGRLFRLISKLNTILERDEMNLDTNWSETDDRYILKLFRDFVFHQTTDVNGTPLLDMSHIVSCLNKLDWGSPEKFFLVSRDNYSTIHASYKDLKRCLDTSFQQLVEASLQLPVCYRSDDYSPREERKNGVNTPRRNQRVLEDSSNGASNSKAPRSLPPNTSFLSSLEMNGMNRKAIRGRGIKGTGGSVAEC